MSASSRLQVPAASAFAVNFVVSLGAPVQVPNVVGLAESKAQAALVTAKLKVGLVTKANSTTVPVGSVISQTPAAGTSAAAGSGVDLAVSFGPAPVTVPNVVGMAQAKAEASITGAGLIVGSVATATSATVAPGNVISQTPIGGASAAAGSAVQLTVSLGVAVTVPNVVGLPQAQAQTAITAAKLTVGTVSKANSLTVAAGNVISQAPASGTTFPQGSLIDFLVSLGPPSVTVPNVVGLAEAQAQATIVAAKLAVGTVNKANSTTVAVGNVIIQAPAAGAMALQGLGRRPERLPRPAPGDGSKCCRARAGAGRSRAHRGEA